MPLYCPTWTRAYTTVSYNSSPLGDLTSIKNVSLKFLGCKFDKAV